MLVVGVRAGPRSEAEPGKVGRGSQGDAGGAERKRALALESSHSQKLPS